MGKTKKRKLEAKHTRPLHPPAKALSAKKTSAKASKAQKSMPSIVPYGKTDRILLVGEGDFSFAQSLVSHHDCGRIVATSFDTEEELARKHPQAAEHISLLREQGQRVLFGVDATKLSHKSIRKPPLPQALTPKAEASAGGEGEDGVRNDKVSSGVKDGMDDSQPKERGWDIISFNFPHVGGKSTDVNRQVRANQSLLVSFFNAALSLLTPRTGLLLVTLFDGEPYTLWNIRDLARHSGYRVERSWRFDAKDYPGYKHARTLGNTEGGGGWKGEERSARSYAFVPKDAPTGLSIGENIMGTKKRRRQDSESDSESGKV